MTFQICIQILDFDPATKVVDPNREPDPEGSEPFCRIRIPIRIIGSDPKPK